MYLFLIHCWNSFWKEVLLTLSMRRNSSPPTRCNLSLHAKTCWSPENMWNKRRLFLWVWLHFHVFTGKPGSAQDVSSPLIGLNTLIFVCPHTVTSYTSVSFWSRCCQIAISGQASTWAAIRPRCGELAGLPMTHPARLTPEEAAKAVMWILMCSNDLLYVLGAFFSGRAPLHSCWSRGVLCHHL